MSESKPCEWCQKPIYRKDYYPSIYRRIKTHSKKCGALLREFEKRAKRHD